MNLSRQAIVTAGKLMHGPGRRQPAAWAEVKRPYGRIVTLKEEVDRLAPPPG
jgi:hypothetical protein